MSKKIGIFGGFFNPFHNGHFESCSDIVSSFDLDHLYVVPTYQSVQKDKAIDVTPEERFLMVDKVLKNTFPKVSVHDCEIKKKGISYTLDTLDFFQKEHPKDELYLVIGVDQFLKFDRWYKIHEILERSNVIVISRPPYPWNLSEDHFPGKVRELIKEKKDSQMLLKTKKSIFFHKIQSLDISSLQIRTLCYQGKGFEHLVPKKIYEDIKNKKFYKSSPNMEISEELVYFFCEQLREKQAVDPVAWDLSKKDYVCDYVLIVSGLNKTHCSALYQSLLDEVKKRYGLLPKQTEGAALSHWIVIDYGNIIVHIFYDYVRKKYMLEELLQGGSCLRLN